MTMTTTLTTWSRTAWSTTSLWALPPPRQRLQLPSRAAAMPWPTGHRQGRSCPAGGACRGQLFTMGPLELVLRSDICLPVVLHLITDRGPPTGSVGGAQKECVFTGN